MNDESQNPFASPQARLNTEPGLDTSATGVFLGVIFSLPIVGFGVWRLLVEWPGISKETVVVSFGCTALAAGIVASGWGWARLGFYGHRMRLLMMSLIFGAGWLALLISTTEIGWRITDHYWASFKRSDMLTTLLMWLGTSFYAFTQGAVTHRRMRRGLPQAKRDAPTNRT